MRNGACPCCLASQQQRKMARELFQVNALSKAVKKCLHVTHSKRLLIGRRGEGRDNGISFSFSHSLYFYLLFKNRHQQEKLVLPGFWWHGGSGGTRLPTSPSSPVKAPHSPGLPQSVLIVADSWVEQKPNKSGDSQKIRLRGCLVFSKL